MFICKYCEDEFSSSKELKQHEKVCDCNPKNDSRESFVCRFCHKSFYNKDELKKHMLTCSFKPNDEPEDQDS